MSGFEVKRVPSEPTLPETSLARLLDALTSGGYASVPAENVPQEAAPVLYIYPSAFEEFKAHIGWRALTAENRIEQGGILVGEVYRDSDSKIVCGLARHIIPSLKSGNEVYIQFTRDDWLAMYQEFERKYALRQSGEENKQCVLGWYHTHPNMPVRMSNVDKMTHRQFFSSRWQFSVILNPQRGIWSVFNGAECESCGGLMFCPQEDVQKPPIFPEATQSRRERLVLPHEPVRNDSAPLDAVEDSFSQDAAPPSVPPDAAQNDGDAEATEPERGSAFIIKRLPSAPSPKAAPKKRRFIHYKTSSTENPAYFSVAEGQQVVYGIHESFADYFRWLVKKWELPAGESLTLLYNVENKNVASLILPSTPCTVYSISPYSKYGRPHISASGFIYHTKSGEFAEYLPRPYKKPYNVILAVMFSEEEPTNEELQDLYYTCPYFNCALWIHPTLSRHCLKLLTFRFDCIQRWLTRNLPEPLILREPTSRLSRVVTGKELLRNSGIRPYDIIRSVSNFSANAINDRMVIQEDCVTHLFNVLGRLRMSDETCISIGYKTDIQSNRVLPEQSFLSVRIFQRSAQGRLRETHISNRYAETRPTTKFAFLFSGGEVDMAFYRKQLLGYLTALSLNIENAGGFQFYRMN